MGSRVGSSMEDACSTDDLEECCVCLDSLSSAPVAALLKARGTSERACPHFVHSDCAERLWPLRCPLCRATFATLSAPISQDRLAEVGPSRIISGARRLLGEEEGENSDKVTVPARVVVELLAATCPVRQSSLEAVVAHHANDPLHLQESWCDLGGQEEQQLSSSTSPRKDEEIGSEGLAAVLPQCGIMVVEKAPEVVGTAKEDRIIGYPWFTRISRWLRSMLLQASGAAGTAVFAGGCGAGVGMSLGALAAIPSHARIDILGGSDSFAMVERILLVAQMLYYGARRRDLLRRGILWGAPIGSVLGWAGALCVVHPEQHGLWSVFWSGLSGTTLHTLFWGAPAQMESPQQRVDVFDG